MKRLAAILTIAVVVLAMTAGPAFASACAGASCGPKMACEQSATLTCPMNTGVPYANAGCGHPMDRGSRDVASTQPAPDHGLVHAPLVGVFVRPAVPMAPATFPLIDARGAPHLTSVIRI